MAGKNIYKTARALLITLAILLVLGIAGSVYMGMRAVSDAEAAVIAQARTIADRSLTLIFRPEDTYGPASDVRAATLSSKVESAVLDPSEFTEVTLWSPDGAIIYSTEEGRIGNLLSGERERIRLALRGRPQIERGIDTISVTLPFAFTSGAGEEVAIELERDDSLVAGADGPWQTNALILFAALVLVAGLIVGIQRLGASVAANSSFVPSGRGQRIPVRTPTSQPAGASRSLEASQPGLKEEAEARRRAEERARAAEERANVLQDQYRKTLDDLEIVRKELRNRSTSLADPALEERAVKAEALARELQDRIRVLSDEQSQWNEDRQRLDGDRHRLAGERERLEIERDQLAARLAEVQSSSPQSDSGDGVRLRQAEAETIGLRAELEGVQTQLGVALRELEELREKDVGSARLRSQLERAAGESERSREAIEAKEAQLEAARRELDEVRTELRTLRNEEARATMLEDELRMVRAELASLQASQQAELVEREAEFEDKVRSTREEFQSELTQIEASFKQQLSHRETELGERLREAEAALAMARADSEGVRLELAAAREALDEELLRREDLSRELEQVLAERDRIADEFDERSDLAERTGEELAVARREMEALKGEVADARRSELETRSELELRAEELAEVREGAEAAGREAEAAAQRSAKLVRQLAEAAEENAEVNRRLQEMESRRALELAESEGRADIDELLRVTQDRLAGQTEKLMAAEDRVHDLERELEKRAERLEEVESELRTHQMSEAMRQIRGGDREQPEPAGEASKGELPFEDRRASTPFTKELSKDASKTISRILGITQILKHKQDAKDQAQLVKQLTNYARRLDHTVRDLSEADRLARGEIELQVKRTDLESLITRVVEESGIADDHRVEVRVDAVTIGVDQLRTEQIISGLLRASADRTASGKEIVVRLVPNEDGALIEVQDPEPSSDASLSPVVRRFAEAQGGWARVENREGGGSTFVVFLPDGAPPKTKPSEPERHPLILVRDDVDETGRTPEQILVQELQRLSELSGGED